MGMPGRHKIIVMIFTIIAYCMLVVSAFADGFIVIPHPPPSLPHIPAPTPFPLEVKYHFVDVEIEDLAATTLIDQEFYNPTARRLEGYYIFPVPKGAVINCFSMFIDGKETEAELLDAEKARKIYEDIVRRQIDPALLEYYGTALFKARIFPIEPHSTKRVKISYREILTRDNGTIAYQYPLNTEKFSSKPLKEVRIQVSIQSRDILKNLYCTSHDARMLRKNAHHATMTYEAQHVKPDRDFNLYYSTDRSKVGISLLTHRQPGEDGYFFLNICPDFGITETDIADKDISFVLDVSGSMAGEKLEQAKKALLFCISNLNRGDRFEIIRFSTEAEALFKNLAPADEKHLDQARKYIKGLRAIGGTNIEEALTLALDAGASGSRPHMIIFITDGKPTIGQTREDPLLDIIKKTNRTATRIFTFGIGNEINTHLLDKITIQTKAFRTYVGPEEDIEIKISDLYTKVQSPVFTDLKLNTTSEIRLMKTYPKDLPDLFKGASITILGRYRGHGKAGIILEGRLKGKRKKLEFNRYVHETTDRNDFIPPLWAARRIGYLLDQIRLNGESRELMDEVTHLARQHGIITPYTSYLILEDERDRVAHRTMAPGAQTLGNMVPESGDFEMRAGNEYIELKSKSGKGSVQASKEVQKLNQSLNIAQTHQGKTRLHYKDRSGKSRNVAQQIKNIQGRAVYNSGTFWIDSRIQDKKTDLKKRIQFSSPRYFELLRDHPESAGFLALGRNVRFVLNHTVYEIYE